MIPRIILISLVFSFFCFLYLIDELDQPAITIKIIGHQWYWRYEYNDFPHITFDSFIMDNLYLNKGKFWLLEIDIRIVVPILTEIRLLVTASDVIHAWNIFSIGLKADAIPGRLNQLRLIVNRAAFFAVNV